MRFYINILTTYFPDIDPPYDVYYQQLLEQVELAEELGWECFMFNEHHFLGYGGLVANPAVLLAAAAARTSRIRLGPCIAILPLRHPLQSAEDYAMVDAISGGRLEFGIGSGNTEMDYKVFGVTRENDRQRLDEAFDVILKAWTNERVSHHGVSGNSINSPSTPDRCRNLIRRSGLRVHRNTLSAGPAATVFTL
jgi:alkanesulfonate monooxygenase SsuD/methylene tetrahydromethanopterin reductase-like flavin-dependent oxidoreductase (luciferase family)